MLGLPAWILVSMVKAVFTIFSFFFGGGLFFNWENWVGQPCFFTCIRTSAYIVFYVTITTE